MLMSPINAKMMIAMPPQNSKNSLTFFFVRDDRTDFPEPFFERTNRRFWFKKALHDFSPLSLVGRKHFTQVMLIIDALFFCDGAHGVQDRQYGFSVSFLCVGRFV